jgi:hypothetical protein
MDVGRVPLSQRENMYRDDKLDKDPMVSGIAPRLNILTFRANKIRSEDDTYLVCYLKLRKAL